MKIFKKLVQFHPMPRDDVKNGRNASLIYVSYPSLILKIVTSLRIVEEMRNQFSVLLTELT